MHRGLELSLEFASSIYLISLDVSLVWWLLIHPIHNIHDIFSKHIKHSGFMVISNWPDKYLGLLNKFIERSSFLKNFCFVVDFVNFNIFMMGNKKFSLGTLLWYYSCPFYLVFCACVVFYLLCCEFCEIVLINVLVIYNIHILAYFEKMTINTVLMSVIQS